MRRLRLGHAGPFTGTHIRIVLEAFGFECIGKGSRSERAVYRHDDGRLVTIDHEWDSVHGGDAIFNCLRRDLGVSASSLLRRLNQAASSDR